MKLYIYDTLNNADYRPLTAEHIARIQKTFPDIDVATGEADAERHIADADIIAGYPGILAGIDIKAARKLQWLHSFSAGVDRIVTPELIASPIVLSNSSGIHATPIAEHTVGFLLVWVRQFMEAFRTQERHEWKKLNATELRGKTVFIVGLGAIGTELARLLQPFGANVVGVVRETRREAPPYVDRTIMNRELDDALPEADFVCLCLPHAPETHHRFGAVQFSKMRKTAAITNIGRGPVIDEEALVQALNDKQIAGALLDVTYIEPLGKESALWDMPNVFITAHYSGLSEKYMDRAIDRLILNLKAYRAGESLPNLVNKEAGY